MALTASDLVPLAVIEGILVLGAVALFVTGVLTLALFIAAIILTSFIGTALILNKLRTN